MLTCMHTETNAFAYSVSEFQDTTSYRKFDKLPAPTGTCDCSEQGVAWALQLSDLHLSVYSKHWLPHYGDKEGDLQ